MEGLELAFIEKLDIEEAVVSIDTIDTLVNIAQHILYKRAHYFLALKETQGALHEAVFDAFRYNKPLDAAFLMSMP